MELPASFRTFTDASGRIQRLPVKLSKKRELSLWLATLLEPGRSYSEQEISELFEEFVDDFALMRRMLVESGTIARERDCSAYWIVESGD